MTETNNSQASEFASEAAKIAAERRCTDIAILDLTGKSPATDYYVIATGTSDRQMRTVADEITELGKELGFGLYGRAGYDRARWILLDFVDVVVHIFDRQYREFYDLAMLWGDAERIEIGDKQNETSD